MKLTKEQVLSIPDMLKTNTIRVVALHFQVSPYAIFYWIRKLRKKGVVVETRPRGRAGLL